MRIEKAELRGFGKFESRTLTFEKGLNIVFGNNESGKSTIQAFIRGMLFGLKSGRISKDGTLPPAKKYKPWKLNDYNGFIEYSLDDGQLYRIGRNFSNNSVRIFDSLFNDITNSFEVSKEKGALFAEKHLGINETCFDKTVFIRQMESRIDDDGGRELLSRLTNISQTGYEDISFKRAQEAIKEALVRHVGTDKTTTRPLDRIVARLQELKTLKENLLEKRNSLFSVENELNDALTASKNIECKKNIFATARQIIEIRKNLEGLRKKRVELGEVLESIHSNEDELEKVLGREKEVSEVEKEFERYSAFDNEDIDRINSDYQSMLHLIEENAKFQEEINAKKEYVEKTRLQYNTLSAFERLDSSVETNVLELNKDLEHLKAEYEKKNIEVLNEKIKNIQYREKRMKYNIAIALAVSLIFFAGGFFSIPTGFVLSPVGLLVTGYMIYTKNKISKELSMLLKDKKIAFVYVNEVLEEINKKQNVLKKIFEAVGAENIEEFLRLKAAYDLKTQQISSVSGDILRLENLIQANNLRTGDLKRSICEKLIRAGIIESSSEDVNEKHIKDFKYGVRRYCGIKPSGNYIVQRCSDLQNNLKLLFKKAANLCGQEYENKEQISNLMQETDNEVIQLEGSLAKAFEILKGLYLSAELSLTDLNNFKFRLLNAELKEIETSIGKDYDKIADEFNYIQLKIKEYETLLKTLADDDDAIQKIDEEYEELTIKRNQLEDLSISLKTALDLLTEASMEIQRDFAPALNSRMGDIISRISSGKYSDLRADDNLALKVITPETGEVIPAISLSGGTIDQAYLALRIASAELISNSGEKLPLIMDEVFAQYDDIRTRETFKYLEELSVGRQIIFFTCKQREVDIVKSVCGNNINVMEIN